MYFTGSETIVSLTRCQWITLKNMGYCITWIKRAHDTPIAKQSTTNRIYLMAYPANKLCNESVNATSKRRFDVIITFWLRNLLAEYTVLQTERPRSYSRMISESFCSRYMASQLKVTEGFRLLSDEVNLVIAVDFLFVRALACCDNKTHRTGINQKYNMALLTLTMFTAKLRTSLKVKMLISTQRRHLILLKLYQCLAWRIRCHTLAFRLLHAGHCLIKPDPEKIKVIYRQNSGSLIIHYNDVMMRAMAPHITGVSMVCSIVWPGSDQRKHQSSVSLAFVRGIH